MKKKSGELVNIWMPRGKTAFPADKTQTRSDSPTLALHSTPAYKSISNTLLSTSKHAIQYQNQNQNANPKSPQEC